MKALRWIIIVVMALLIIVIVAGYTMPREIVVSTSEEINLTPLKVFHFVAGFVDRTAWDPWIKADTAVKCTFDIKSGYTGSEYMWEGPKIGAGKMLVDSVVQGSYILNTVSFSKGKPIPEEWTFTPSSNGTNLTWSIKMTGRSAFGRIMNRMFKSVIQNTIDSGKIDLKNYLETHGVTMSSLSEVRVEEFPAVEALVSSLTGTMDQVSSLLGKCYGNVMVAIEEQKLQPQGMPFAFYSDYDPETGKYTMTAGMPVSSGGKNSGDVKVVRYNAFTAVKGLHTGPYEDLQSSYDEIIKYAEENNIALGQESWEFYLNDPAEVNDPTLLQTLIAMPLKK